MIYDLMPRWLRWALNMDSAVLPTDVWTWRHTCRYGFDPRHVIEDGENYARLMREQPNHKGPLPRGYR